MGLVVFHLHLHGLLRGQDLELGRDADTGGQTTYVLELARSMAARPEVERVELITRRIHAAAVGPDYARPHEPLGPRLAIRRVGFGPRGYLAKEELWPHLDRLAASLEARLRAAPRLPDWIHAHYADAGYVGVLLQQRLGVPLVFTAHSLGREKRRRLLSAGEDPLAIEARYHFRRRIAAEERALAHSALVVTSTQQELTGQYASYRRFCPSRARVIPPGVDGCLFHPPRPGEPERGAGAALAGQLDRLLRHPDRPPLLAICRPDPRKNVAALLEAFAASGALHSQHNLVLVMGCRGPGPAPAGDQSGVLEAVERWRQHPLLQGRLALPAGVRREQIPALYRWAARRGGVFVNPALTEPFGLTLLEAAASGLPVVATDDGGPREILRHCRHGLLVDVRSPAALQRALERSLADDNRWRHWSRNGLEAVGRYYSWEAHGATYLREACALIARRPVLRAASAAAQLGGISPLPLGCWRLVAGIQ